MNFLLRINFLFFIIPLGPLPNFFAEMHFLISKFIWGGKYAKIKLTTLLRRKLWRLEAYLSQTSTSIIVLFKWDHGQALLYLWVAMGGTLQTDLGCFFPLFIFHCHLHFWKCLPLLLICFHCTFILLFIRYFLLFTTLFVPHCCYHYCC